MATVPSTQHAVQFVGKDQITINAAKPVDPVGPTQMLLEIEACGICFSDTKLLHAFDSHPRKSEVTMGLRPDELAQMPSYHPGPEPITPGHEPVGRVIQCGDQVTHFREGDRVLVQADWKHIRTAQSNAAFGYNFDGALEEYVVVDERCVVSPDGEEFLIHVSEEPAAASIGLIEPWATVEGSYAFAERNHLLDDGRLLVVGEGDVSGLTAQHRPSQTTEVRSIAEAPQDDVLFDDIVYFGSDATVIEALIDRLNKRGILCIVLGGVTIDRDVSVDIGRIHYDFIRLCGTVGHDPADGYAWIPANGEVRDGDRIAIVGAAGPMGTMHTLRNAALGLAGVQITAADVNTDRLAHLASLVGAQSERTPVAYQNTADEPLAGAFTYIACMVPVPSILAELVELAGPDAVVNAFAGIPTGNPHPINLQHLIENRVFVFGTSGSDVKDMRTVVRKIEEGSIDTLVSLDAICGIAGFKDAIQAVMDRTSGGKIMVFPQLHDLGYIRLADLAEALPGVAQHLDNGVWTKEAEAALLGLR